MCARSKCPELILELLQIRSRSLLRRHRELGIPPLHGLRLGLCGLDSVFESEVACLALVKTLPVLLAEDPQLPGLPLLLEGPRPRLSRQRLALALSAVHGQQHGRLRGRGLLDLSPRGRGGRLGGRLGHLALQLQHLRLDLPPHRLEHGGPVVEGGHEQRLGAPGLGLKTCCLGRGATGLALHGLELGTQEATLARELFLLDVGLRLPLLDLILEAPELQLPLHFLLRKPHLHLLLEGSTPLLELLHLFSLRRQSFGEALLGIQFGLPLRHPTVRDAQHPLAGLRLALCMQHISRLEFRVQLSREVPHLEDLPAQVRCARFCAVCDVGLPLEVRAEGDDGFAFRVQLGGQACFDLVQNLPRRVQLLAQTWGEDFGLPQQHASEVRRFVAFFEAQLAELPQVMLLLGGGLPEHLARLPEPSLILQLLEPLSLHRHQRCLLPSGQRLPRPRRAPQRHRFRAGVGAAAAEALHGFKFGTHGFLQACHPRLAPLHQLLCELTREPLVLGARFFEARCQALLLLAGFEEGLRSALARSLPVLLQSGRGLRRLCSGADALNLARQLPNLAPIRQAPDLLLQALHQILGLVFRHQKRLRQDVLDAEPLQHPCIGSIRGGARIRAELEARGEAAALGLCLHGLHLDGAGLRLHGSARAVSRLGLCNCDLVPQHVRVRFTDRDLGGLGDLDLLPGFLRAMCPDFLYLVS
mmetsp:Transcript_21501/g.73641  ORF Transcript_21501/g.73641 Transcript_21501/m.73641 type:complete len:700 (-) Transcript_21501:1778-3877(-)